MDAETRDLLKGSIRDLFASTDDIVAGLEELGWSDVVAEDAIAATDLLFSEQGAAGKASTALDTVAYATLSKGVRHPVVHPMGGDVPAHLRDGAVVIDGVLLADQYDVAVVATGEREAFVVDGAVLGAHSTRVAGFDPASRFSRVSLRLDPSQFTPIEFDWEETATAARRALAAELVGNGSAMLALAADQIANRHQFGRPIGANQTPRHRLAESYALLGGAAELVRKAGRSGNAWDARIAKAYAGHAVDITSRACLQVCGAIGLTTEHRLPAYVQRARVLDALYGGWTTTAAGVGAELVAGGNVPHGDRL